MFVVKLKKKQISDGFPVTWEIHVILFTVSLPYKLCASGHLKVLSPFVSYFPFSNQGHLLISDLIFIRTFGLCYRGRSDLFSAGKAEGSERSGTVLTERTWVNDSTYTIVPTWLCYDNWILSRICYSHMTHVNTFAQFSLPCSIL